MGNFLRGVALIIVLPIEPIFYVLANLWTCGDKNSLRTAIVSQSIFAINIHIPWEGINSCMFGPVNSMFKSLKKTKDAVETCWMFVCVFIMSIAWVCIAVFFLAGVLLIILAWYFMMVFILHFIGFICYISFLLHNWVTELWEVTFLPEKNRKAASILESADQLDLNIDFTFNDDKGGNVYGLLCGLLFSVILSPITIITFILYWMNHIFIRRILTLPMHLLVIPFITTSVIWSAVILYLITDLLPLTLFLFIVIYNAIPFFVFLCAVYTYYNDKLNVYGVEIIGFIIFGPVFISLTWVLSGKCLRICWYFAKLFIWNIKRLRRNKSEECVPRSCYANESYCIVRDINSDLILSKIGNREQYNHRCYIIIGLFGSIMYFPITLISSIVFGLQKTTKHIFRMPLISICINIPCIASLTMWIISILFVSKYYNAMYRHTSLVMETSQTPIINAPHFRRLLTVNSTDFANVTNDTTLTQYSTTQHETTSWYSTMETTKTSVTSSTSTSTKTSSTTPTRSISGTFECSDTIDIRIRDLEDINDIHYYSFVPTNDISVTFLSCCSGSVTADLYFYDKDFTIIDDYYNCVDCKVWPYSEEFTIPEIYSGHYYVLGVNVSVPIYNVHVYCDEIMDVPSTTMNTVNINNTTKIYIPSISAYYLEFETISFNVFIIVFCSSFFILIISSAFAYKIQSRANPKQKYPSYVYLMPGFILIGPILIVGTPFWAHKSLCISWYLWDMVWWNINKYNNDNDSDNNDIKCSYINKLLCIIFLIPSFFVYPMTHFCQHLGDLPYNIIIIPFCSSFLFWCSIFVYLFFIDFWAIDLFIITLLTIIICSIDDYERNDEQSKFVTFLCIFTAYILSFPSMLFGIVWWPLYVMKHFKIIKQSSNKIDKKKEMVKIEMNMERKRFDTDRGPNIEYKDKGPSAPEESVSGYKGKIPSAPIEEMEAELQIVEIQRNKKEKRFDTDRGPHIEYKDKMPSAPSAADKSSIQYKDMMPSAPIELQMVEIQRNKKEMSDDEDDEVKLESVDRNEIDHKPKVKYYIGQKLLIKTSKIAKASATIIDIENDRDCIVVKYELWSYDNGKDTEVLHIINDIERIEIVKKGRQSVVEQIQNEDESIEQQIQKVREKLMTMKVEDKFIKSEDDEIKEDNKDMNENNNDMNEDENNVNADNVDDWDNWDNDDKAEQSVKEKSVTISFERKKSISGTKSMEKECVVCMDNVKNHICVPCGHLCICGDCIDIIGNKCPMCQAPFTMLMKVFR